MLLSYFIGFLCIHSAVAELVGPTVWPMPTSESYGKESVSITSALEFSVTSSSAHQHTAKPVETLRRAFLRYSQLMFPHSVAPGREVNASVTKVKVECDSLSEEYPQLETDESYELTIPSAGEVTLRAPTVYGALRGLESLSQLVFYDFAETQAYLVWPATISDSPRYAHRGMLLDTARHYEAIPNIQRTIDALSYAKYNVLHWHVVDDQSFPFESQAFPKLWDGAYSSQERYSHADIEELVEYGRLRGVKVMIEFDVPGHASSWCAGYPEICPSDVCKTPLNPASSATMPLIEGLVAECTEVKEGSKQALFPYSLFHLGGDEVGYACWELSDEVKEWQQEMGFTGSTRENSEQTYEYFVDAVANITRAANRTPVQWVEVYEHFGNALDKNTIVHIWKQKSTMDAVLLDGYKAILSDNDKWYLDHLEVSWEEMYYNEPTEGLTDPATASNIIGGESCMWAETVDNSDLDQTVWPRAAAVAERLWTSYDVISSPTSGNSVEDRLETFRCLLNARSIAAAPVTNNRARHNPSGPGSCYTQRRF